MRRRVESQELALLVDWFEQHAHGLLDDLDLGRAVETEQATERLLVAFLERP